MIDRWKQQLQERQKESEFTNDTIKILVKNILPAHVGKFYSFEEKTDSQEWQQHDKEREKSKIAQFKFLQQVVAC